MNFQNRKQLLRKESSDQLPLLQKNQTPEDAQKMPLFFNSDNSQYRQELQMPIKIQGNSRFRNTFQKQQRIHEYAHQSSQQVLINELCSNSESRPEYPQIFKENNKEYQQILITSQNKFDSLESLLMPLYDPNSQVQNEVPQYGFQDEFEVKIEEKNEYDGTFLHAIQDLRSGQDFKKLQQRKGIYSLMNSFRAFYQATSICINNHRLSKKDSLNKVYLNILNVMSKQNKKMFVELEKQRRRIDEFYQRQKAFNIKMNQWQKIGGKDQLLKTGIQDEGLCIKKKMIQNDLEDDKNDL